MIIRRVDPLSCGKVLGALYALIGLIAGCIFTFLSLVGLTLGGGPGGAPPFLGVILGMGAFVFLTVIYGGLGFLFGIVFAAFYNVIASVVGGIEIDLDKGR